MNRSVKMFAVMLILILSGLLAIWMLRNSGRENSPVFVTTPTVPASSTNSQPYVVTMSPMGPVRFVHPPQRIVTLDANYNDMLVTLQQEQKLQATGSQNGMFDGFYNQLPGVKPAMNQNSLTYLYGAAGVLFDKERLYALRAEIHHIDPLQLASSRGWSRADVEEIARNVGPFFANRYSRENSYPGKEPYEYYTVWGLSDKVAQVYRRPDRIARLKLIYDKLVANIAAKLPPPEKRPSVGLVCYNNGKFLPFSLQREGFGQVQYRLVGAKDAFLSIQSSTYADAGRGTSLDLEGLVALNPDILIVPWAINSPSRSGANRTGYNELMKLKNDPLGQRLTAFQTNRVYPGGTPLQGPIFLIFQIEMAAKQIYPEIFGPYRDDQQYPAAEQLFDRSAVAEIVKGTGTES